VNAVLQLEFFEWHNRLIYDLLDSRNQLEVRESSQGDVVIRKLKLDKNADVKSKEEKLESSIKVMMKKFDHEDNETELVDEWSKFFSELDVEQQKHFLEILSATSRDPTLRPDPNAQSFLPRSLSCTTIEEVEAAVQKGFSDRQVGSSDFHDQSSRSHAILNIHISTNNLVLAKAELTKLVTLAAFQHDGEKPARLTRKFKVDEEDPENAWFIQNIPKELWEKPPGVARNQVHAFMISALKKYIATQTEMLKRSFPGVGGSLCFVDLAGSEVTMESMKNKGQTLAQRQESKYINMSLMALNEVLKARYNKTRIAYRSSKLTLILKRYIASHSEWGNTVMLGCLSPAATQSIKTVKTLKYASLFAM